MALFESLKEIDSLPTLDVPPVWTRDRSVKARLIALALLSLRSTSRMSLISAVFGLLAFLSHDEDESKGVSTTPSHHLSPEWMDSRALGVVFAPVLLGNLTERIELDEGSLRSPQRISFNTLKLGLLHARKARKAATECSTEIASSVERNTLCEAVVVLLIRQWKDVVRQVLICAPSLESRFSSCSAGPIKSYARKILKKGAHPQKRGHSSDRSTPTRSLSLSQFGTYLSDSASFVTNTDAVSGIGAFSATAHCNHNLIKRSASLNVVSSEKREYDEFHHAMSSAQLREIVAPQILLPQQGPQYSSNRGIGRVERTWEREPSISSDSLLGSSVFAAKSTGIGSVQVVQYVTNRPLLKLHTRRMQQGVIKPQTSKPSLKGINILKSATGTMTSLVNLPMRAYQEMLGILVLVKS